MNEYKSGYNQALADVRRHIDEAMAMCQDASRDDPRGPKLMHERLRALRWVRAGVKGLRR